MVLSIRTGLFRGLLSPNVLIRTIGNYLVFCESYAFQIISVAHGAIFSTDRRFRFKFSTLIFQQPERDIGIRLCVSRVRYTSSTKDDSKEEDGHRSSPLLHSVAFLKDSSSKSPFKIRTLSLERVIREDRKEQQVLLPSAISKKFRRTSRSRTEAAIGQAHCWNAMLKTIRNRSETKNRRVFHVLTVTRARTTSGRQLANGAILKGPLYALSNNTCVVQSENNGTLSLTGAGVCASSTIF